MSLVDDGRGMVVATVASRVTGFVRTLAVVAALGYGLGMLDAYTVANGTPNMVYELVLGGTLAGVLVPLMVRTDEDEAFAQKVLTLVVVGLGALVVVAVIAAPLIVELMAPEYSGAQRDAAVGLLRFFMPQVLFYGISATMAALLNARGRFGPPMWAPVANNLVVIEMAVLYLVVGGAREPAQLTDLGICLLGAGTTAGVVAQMITLMVSGRRAGLDFRLRRDPRGIGLKKIAKMAGWTFASVVAAQAVFVVTTRLMSKAGEGAVAVQSQAYLLFQLPYAVVAVTVITGVLPRMSRAAAEHDLGRVTADLSKSLRRTGVVLVPVAAALVVLGPQITQFLFGVFSGRTEAVDLTGALLTAYGFALVPFAAYQVMLRVFFALGDTRTPALISMGVSGLQIIAALALAKLTYGDQLVIALAGATAFAYTVGLATTAQLLRRRLGRMDGHRLLGSHGRMLTAATVAGAAALAVAQLVDTGTLVAATVAGAALYCLCARGLRIEEFAALLTYRSRSAGPR